MCYNDFLLLKPFTAVCSKMLGADTVGSSATDASRLRSQTPDAGTEDRAACVQLRLDSAPIDALDDPGTAP